MSAAKPKPYHFLIARTFRLFANEISKLDPSDSKNYNYVFSFYKGSLANDLFKSGSEVPTGLCTEEAMKLGWSKHHKVKPTKEHIMSRNRATEYILRRILKYETSEARLVSMIMCSCRTVLCTKPENGKLESHRKKYNKTTSKCIMPWRLHYKDLGYPLVKRSVRLKYYYLVENMRYDSILEVAEKFNISKRDAERRFLNKKSFYGWKKMTMDGDVQVFRKQYRAKTS